MPRTIEVIYENGVFKPIEKVDLKEHEKIKIILPTKTDSPSAKKNKLDSIFDIANDCSDSDLSTHHDKYLYGDESNIILTHTL
jgi:predicted DNA-binding antitoxin AbrB/MazE fold protein